LKDIIKVCLKELKYGDANGSIWCSIGTCGGVLMCREKWEILGQLNYSKLHKKLECCRAREDKYSERNRGGVLPSQLPFPSKPFCVS
jgi:hypothetical protein